ncbi:sigma 54-interacting transcriptional regulator [Thalassotalea psychrophila]|uniref:Sigma 54-interacting transcriptional regulator n=1 Tax=Thalassotalea psychrophila TaxID=3065647 RepID=A0ABY9TSD2_9GAMM|nr:sigma 54-interacting transcriptional regulator [Colwelliaceae bacterium SQ149]
MINTNNKTALLISNSKSAAKIVDMLEQQDLTVAVNSKIIKQIVCAREFVGFDFIIIDSNGIESSTDKERLTVLMNCPVLFFNEKQAISLTDNYHQAKFSFSEFSCPINKIELQQLLHLSLYKFNIREQEYKQSHLLKNTISCIGDILIYLDQQGDVFDISNTAELLFGKALEDVKGKPWYNLVQTRQDLTAKQSQQFIATAIKIQTVTKLQPLAIQTSHGSSQLVDGVVGPITYANGKTGVVLILRQLSSLDSIPKELNFTGKSKSNLPSTTPLVSGILLLSPDNFNELNLQQGRDYGDRVLYCIGELLREFVRPTDMSSHYGGTMFMVMFSQSSAAQIKNIVNQLEKRLMQHTFLEEQSSLKFSLGIALNSQLLNYSPVELFYQANYSLSQARDLGGSQIREWQQQSALLQIGNLDRLSGNVSKSANHDYQKMLMQWSILNFLNEIEQLPIFIKELLTQLINGFGLKAAGFYSLENNTVKLHQAINQSGKELTKIDICLSENQISHIKSIQNEHGKVFTSVLAEQGIQKIIPIYIPNKPGYFLWLSSEQDQDVTSKDHHVLYNIADFVALKVERLCAGTNDTKVIESNNSLNFWYKSSAMTNLMKEVEMVAPTNATVLITGESGTGKEMLAQSIHQLSDRKNKPFIIFDCGAVVESLVESELFGHQKGSFTGANRDVTGRIQEADGGTLFLDEIGELPLEVQVKLLRFVQEKQYSKVGSGNVKKVDVRLIAATNVNLKEQISKGKFREDLYFRLNVFKIENVPLRQRTDDIVLIAKSYLDIFSNEYNKSIIDFSEPAKQALLEYLWPGNIRELKNLVHRSVIVCSDNIVTCHHLGLFPANPNSNSDTCELPEQAVNTNEAIAVNSDFTKQDNDLEAKQSGNSICIAKDLINHCLPSHASENTFKIGPWIEYQLYRVSLEQHQQIALQAANSLNLAESTFRRRWKKLQADVELNNYVSSFEQKALVAHIQQLKMVESKVAFSQSLLAQACKELRLSVKLTSSLLDVSPPTLRRLVAS